MNIDSAMTAARRYALVTIFCVAIPAADATQDASRADGDAQRIMMQAVEARALWDDAFPGFTADVEVNYEGAIHRGQVRVTPQGEMKWVDGSEPGNEAWEWARGWLGMLVFHRMGQGEAGDYRDIRQVGDPDHPLGVLLALDDEFDSSFRVDGKIIRQVNRDLSPRQTGGNNPDLKRVRINVLEARETPAGKILPLHFVINYFGDEQQLTMVDTLSSGFVRLGEYDLPRWCRVITTADGEMTAGVLRLSNHHLSE